MWSQKYFLVHFLKKTMTLLNVDVGQKLGEKRCTLYHDKRCTVVRGYKVRQWDSLMKLG